MLAAGRGTRLAGRKLALPWGETTILGAVLDTLRTVGLVELVVVLGHDPEHLAPIVELAVGRWVVNARFDTGMLSSVQCGLHALGPVDGALVWPADQPLVQPATVAAVAMALVPPAGLVVPTCEGRRGHPIAVAADLFAVVDELDPSIGLRQLRERVPDRVRVVPVTDAGIRIDIDTPADYRRHRPPRSPER